jgi:dephospho-CoA kinase
MHLLKLKPNLIILNDKERLHGLDKPIVGLTGGIATGKSTVAKLMHQDGLCVIDADALVKKIYALAETKDFIKGLDSKFVPGDTVDFKVLRQAFFNDASLKQKIENYLYARLPATFKSQVDPNAQVVIYDVPLLFEKELHKLVDVSVLVYAPRETQIERLVARDKINQELANSILDHQMDIEKKRDLAAFCLDNTENLEKLSLKYQLLRDDLFEN